MNKRIKQIGAITVWLLVSLAVFAAEAENAGEPETQATEQADIETPQETVEPLPDIGLIEEIEEAENGEDDGNFVPSIQITEDLPVAFPVDI